MALAFAVLTRCVVRILIPLHVESFDLIISIFFLELSMLDEQCQPVRIGWTHINSTN